MGIPRSLLEDRHVISMPVNQLTAYERNARTHSAKQVQQIANSIAAFGFTNPVLIGPDNRIIAGHGRVEAAKKLGLGEIPTIRLDHLNENQIKAYVLADNKIAANAGWDPEILAGELEYLSSVIDFDIDITGFEIAEVDLIIGTEYARESLAEDTVELPPETASITAMGDLWVLDEHRLYCGDALQKVSFEALLGSERAAMILTDPPYNVPINRHVCGLGKIKHPEFKMGVGEMDDAAFEGFLEKACENMAAFSVPGSLHYVFMDWRHMRLLLNAASKVYTELKNVCVWNKDNAGMGSLYRSKHEMVAVFKQGTGPHINNIELGKHGRYRTNVWDYPGVNTMRKGRMEDLTMHPTVKPVAMMADAIMDCTRRQQIILDPFAGSGTTLIAAEKAGRFARCIELDPRYCDVIIKRWQNYTGKDAILASGGKSYNEIVKAGGWR